MKAAIKELMDEHDVIIRMLTVLQGMTLSLNKGGSLDAADLEGALDFIATFADSNHHGKEEDLLFPAMEKVGFPRGGGPIGVMLMEHVQGRALVAAMRTAATRLKIGSATAGQEWTLAAGGYANLLNSHIYKENNILYPMAIQALPETAWEKLSADFAQVEKERMGPRKRAEYETLLARLEAAFPAPPLAAPTSCHG